MQIFDSHGPEVLEGSTCCAAAAVVISDFAVWDGDTRIPRHLEKRRADELYAGISSRRLTRPLANRTRAGGTSAFSAKVFPIPAYGSKRVEMEYTEMLPIESLPRISPFRENVFRHRSASANLTCASASLTTIPSPVLDRSAASAYHLPASNGKRRNTKPSFARRTSN